MNAKKGDWVLIHNIVLKPEERAPQVPDDTKEVPLEMWVKGFINHDASVDDEVEITTMTGRIVRGRLIDINPYYKHDYGKCVPELLKIGLQLKDITFGGEDRE
ncbi:2-amino-4-oxopentanoate thiolase subunit OrtA [Tepidibacter formicigenes]|jgi:hypothetical protein|uniref:2-amino-4-ketopentanoate thiolase alpha subunit n=1 Tax=Tepidibacter formicigenes DSM 15518 TaxID=1123349 RepID=A0A1M6MUD8_9FIRM|nr:2-amino-4-oxopentanoate thiolase subunit OrtA [Tepidibacter formicigenes]SHJ87128.1 hypothetical protein SAMN02744037_01053 [Tepidibacter formicigenes DSM 15518]